MKWTLWFWGVIAFCVSAFAWEYDEEGLPIDPPEEVAVAEHLDYLQKSSDLSKEDYDVLIEKMENLKNVENKDDREYLQVANSMEFLYMTEYTGECDENRGAVKFCIKTAVELYLSGSTQFAFDRENLYTILRNYPSKLPTVEKYLRSHRRELMERFVDDLAILYDQISQKKEKAWQKDLKEWDKYYQTHFPLKINYLAEVPEDEDAGWPDDLYCTPRYPDLERPYQVIDPKEREEYIRMLPKAVSWVKLCQLPNLRREYSEVELEIYNAFAFFYDSGKSNMKELRQLLNDRKISKHMQDAILEEMKKPYDSSLASTLGRERRQKAWETGRDEIVIKHLP